MKETKKSAFNTAKSYLEKGNKLQDENNFDEAIAAYYAALEIDPNSYKAYHGLGIVFTKTQELNEAIAAYKKAIELYPYSTSSRFRLGQLLFNRGSIEDTIDQYQKCVELNPSHHEAYLGLGEAWCNQQNWAKAADAYQRAIELNPSNYVAYSRLKTVVALANRLKDDEKLVRYSLTSDIVQGELISVLFILPAKGGGGGAHSVMQECLTMYRYGVKAHIAVNEANYSSFLKAYPDIPEIKELVIAYETLADLVAIAKKFSVVCATVYSSVSIVEQLVKNGCRFLPAYYVQDYEPLFTKPGSWEWRMAVDSYTCIPGMVLFAKTHWLCNVVSQNHSVKVYKVEPSLDHNVYFPDLTRQDEHIQIAAMVRFKTPRRGPYRTLRVIQKLSEMLPETVKFIIFGSDASQFPEVPQNTIIKEQITRKEVAGILRSSDIFLDLSDYQAFGRTALEAMACGCVPVVPDRGGTDEFAVPSINSWVIDTCSEAMAIDSVMQYFKMNVDERRAMRLRALSTASQYSLNRAAFSILNTLQEVFTQSINSCDPSILEDSEVAS